MRHPSGAVASFYLTPTLHGRSFENFSCSAQPNTDAYQKTAETYPSRFYAWSVTKKVISGAGIGQPLTWTYAYGPDNSCYASGLSASDPLACTTTSTSEKWVEVVDPRGVKSTHVFSNRADHSEGYLLRVERPGRVEANVYEFGPPGQWANVGQFASYVGTSIMPSSGRGWYQSRVVPLRERSIFQDGMKFTWHVNAFDVMARPTSVTESSAPYP